MLTVVAYCVNPASDTVVQRRNKQKFQDIPSLVFYGGQIFQIQCIEFLQVGLQALIGKDKPRNINGKIDKAEGYAVGIAYIYPKTGHKEKEQQSFDKTELFLVKEQYAVRDMGKTAQI